MMQGNFAQQQQQQQQHANFMTPAAPIQQQPQQQQQQQQPQKAAPAAKPKEILPIPPEHLDLQTTFGGLRLKCMSAASHPQTRRKLEDVGKKLEILYDKLREHVLTQATLDSLHGLCSHLKGSDYPSAVAFYTGMVSGPGFAEIAAFMPALKVLITLANQQGVQF